VPSPTSLSAVRADAIARRDRGDLNSARTLLERALEAAAMTSGEDHPEVLTTAHLLAKLHRQSGDLSAARRVLENALFAGTHRHGEDHPLLLSITFDLAEIADELGNRHEARKHYNRIARFGPAAPGFDQQQVQAARAWLGPGAPQIAPVQGQPITLPAPEPLAPPPPPPFADSVASQPLTTGEPLPKRVPSVPPGQSRGPGWEPAVDSGQPAPEGSGLGARLAASGAPIQDVAPQRVSPAPPAYLPPAHVPPAQPPAADEPHVARHAAPADDTPTDVIARITSADTAGSATRFTATPARTEPSRTEPSRTEPSRTEPPRYTPPQDGPFVAPPVSPPVSPPPPAKPAAPLGVAAREVPQVVPGRPIEIPPPPAPPPPKRGRGMVIASLSAAFVAVVAAGVTVFLVLNTKSPSNPEPFPSGPEGAATNVVLLDRGDRITLNWTDPSNGQAQPIVAGNREDEAPRRMGVPAKGATETTLLSLNKNYDYCFRVLLVYTLDDIRQSDQVCTNRKKATPSPTQ
jgi:hypothetical protein